MIFRKFRNTAPTYVKSGRKFRTDSSMPIILSFPLPPPEPAKSPREPDLQILLHFRKFELYILGPFQGVPKIGWRCDDNIHTCLNAHNTESGENGVIAAVSKFFSRFCGSKLSSCTMTSFRIFFGLLSALFKFAIMAGRLLA